jgi:hypothetical protein
MVRHVGVHRADHGDVVYVLGDVRENLGDFDTRLSMFLKLEGRPEAHTGLALGGQRGVGQGLAVILRKHRFRIERINVRRPAVHKQEDDALGFGGQGRHFGRHRVQRFWTMDCGTGVEAVSCSRFIFSCVGARLLGQQPCQPQRGKAITHTGQHLPPRYKRVFPIEIAVSHACLLPVVCYIAPRMPITPV